MKAQVHRARRVERIQKYRPNYEPHDITFTPEQALAATGTPGLIPVRQELKQRWENETHAALDQAAAVRADAKYADAIRAAERGTILMRLLNDQSTIVVQHQTAEQKRQALIDLVLGKIESEATDVEVECQPISQDPSSNSPTITSGP